MTVSRVARTGGSPARAHVNRGAIDVNIVNENLQAEWERGCKWACLALGLTFGPMLALGMVWGWA